MVRMVGVPSSGWSVDCGSSRGSSLGQGCNGPAQGVMSRPAAYRLELLASARSESKRLVASRTCWLSLACVLPKVDLK